MSAASSSSEGEGPSSDGPRRLPVGARVEHPEWPGVMGEVITAGRLEAATMRYPVEVRWEHPVPTGLGTTSNVGWTYVDELLA